MKGISHFAIGIAAASCFPAAVRAGAHGNPLYFILAAAAGVLPDTLDFKFGRYLHRHDMEVTPDPHRPAPQMIADAVAFAVNRAWELKTPFTIKLDTIRLGTDAWQTYDIRFDVPGRRVACELGPVVGGGAVAPSGAVRSRASAVAALVCDVKPDYTATTRVDILDGPVFRMERLPDGRVAPRFLPWHRTWSHSLVTALLLGLVCAVIWDALAGAVVLAAFGLHALTDHLGFMGSCLWFPFRRERREGWHLLRSDSPPANLAAVWLSCVVVFWNLSRLTPWTLPGLNPLGLFFYAALLPGAAFAAARQWLIRRGTTATIPSR
jgi:membrane-bound metal-dependent hydrolase YbcI (DUF457 family)